MCRFVRGCTSCPAKQRQGPELKPPLQKLVCVFKAIELMGTMYQSDGGGSSPNNEALTVFGAGERKCAPSPLPSTLHLGAHEGPETRPWHVWCARQQAIGMRFAVAAPIEKKEIKRVTEEDEKSVYHRRSSALKIGESSRLREGKGGVWPGAGTRAARQQLRFNAAERIPPSRCQADNSSTLRSTLLFHIFILQPQSPYVTPASFEAPNHHVLISGVFEYRGPRSFQSHLRQRHCHRHRHSNCAKATRGGTCALNTVNCIRGDVSLVRPFPRTRSPHNPRTMCRGLAVLFH